jgi:hypothetical protein
MYFRLLLKILKLIVIMLIFSIVVIALVLFLCLWIIITEEQSKSMVQHNTTANGTLEY